MTREIALQCMKSASDLTRELCEECPIYGQTGIDHCFEDSLHYVIGMLEQEPCEDAVSRQAVKTDATDINDGSIKVGDEVINGGVVGVVTHVRDIENGMKAFSIVDEMGKVWNLNDLLIKRTGRKFPQIAEVLKQLRGDKG